MQNEYFSPFSKIFNRQIFGELIKRREIEIRELSPTIFWCEILRFSFLALIWRFWGLQVLNISSFNPCNYNLYFFPFIKGKKRYLSFIFLLPFLIFLSVLLFSVCLPLSLSAPLCLSLSLSYCVSFLVFLLFKVCVSIQICRMKLW